MSFSHREKGGLAPQAWGDEGLRRLRAFDRRLRPAIAAPLCVGFSGGGDSLLALHMTKAWADAHGRKVMALCVDHRLQPQSSAWTRAAGETAARLGVGFRALAWEGPKPERGLAAAARSARHALLAEAARDAGGRVVILGHTADDILEAELMRAEGSTLGGLREWAPSPAWPEGRGVFLLRPMLDLRRGAIRQVLRAMGETWIDDPANADPRSARARARARLAEAGVAVEAATAESPADEALAVLALEAEASTDGFARLNRARLRRATTAAARRWLAAAALCVGGGARPPRGGPLERLLDLVLQDQDFRATLAGSRILGVGEELLIVRDAGERARGGLAPVRLEPGVAAVWDGRFEVTADKPAEVRGLVGAMAGLAPEARLRLRAVPAAARPSLPLMPAGARVRCLVPGRLLAACGVISREPAA